VRFEIAPYLRSVLADGAPVLVVLAGSNGAGKSTFFTEFLAPTGITFVNADEIARAVWGPAAPAHAYHSAALADAVRRDLVARRESFCMETVLSDPAGDKLNFFRAVQGDGYVVVLVYIRIESVELSKARVQQRVDDGGHDVPDEKLELRFARTASNATAALSLADLALVFDNSSNDSPFRLLELWRRGESLSTEAPTLPFDLTHDAETGLVTRRFLERRISSHLSAPRNPRACLAIIKFSERQLQQASRTKYIAALRRCAFLFDKHFVGEKVTARLDDSAVGILLYDATRDEAVGVVRAISDLLSKEQTNSRASVIDVQWPYQFADALINDAIDLCGPAKADPRASVVTVLPTRQVQEAAASALARRFEIRQMIGAGQFLMEIETIEYTAEYGRFFADDMRPRLSLEGKRPLELAEIMLAASEDVELSRRICGEMVSAALTRLQTRQMQGMKDGVVIHCPASGLIRVQESTELYSQFVAAGAAEGPVWLHISPEYVDQQNELTKAIDHLLALGVRLATSIDGGPNSVQYLRRLPFELLYIAEEFVREIETDSNDQAIVSAVVAMARSLKIQCIGEGARNRQARDKLRDLGVSFVIAHALDES